MLQSLALEVLMHRGILAVATVVLSGATIAAQTAVRRVPLQKSGVAMTSPTKYQMNERQDRKTGQTVSFDPKPQVVTTDARSGLVQLSWIGIDGTTKVVTYQRPDAIDVVVKADATSSDKKAVAYNYHLQILHSSGTYLHGFVVQTQVGDAAPRQARGVFVGLLRARGFADGAWWRFAFLPEFSPSNEPGRTVLVQLTAQALPGLVQCRVHGGALGYKGAGEEMPQELAAQLPGYEAWPHGYTIGPDDRLTVLSPTQRAAKLVEWLPEFERQGWMTSERRRHYEAGARRGDLKGLASVVDADLRAEQITTEVRAIVLGLADLLGK
jgi:hypothetical protein